MSESTENVMWSAVPVLRMSLQESAADQKLWKRAPSRCCINAIRDAIGCSSYKPSHPSAAQVYVDQFSLQHLQHCLPAGAQE